MTAQPETTDGKSTATLQKAIAEAKQVAAEIRDAADHLAVVNTVLQDQIPDDVQVGEVAQALAQSEEVEKNVAKSAETLDTVNNALAKATAAQRA